MRYKITLSGKFPSLNEYISKNRAHKQAANAMKKKDENRIIVEVLSQCGRLKIWKPVFIKYIFYEPNKKRDLDNISGYFHKVFQDALVKGGVLANDGWHYITGFSDYFYHDNRNPRIEVEIKEVEE